MTALNVIMLGPPGAGKGTQAAWLARDFDIPKISTGDILRDAVTQGTELGRLIRATMETGQLVPDAAVVGIVRERIERPDATRGFILDGFPRTIGQADGLAALLAEIGQPLDAVVLLDDLMHGRRRGVLTVLLVDVPFEELVRRLRTRLICSACGTGAEPGQSDSDRCKKCGQALVHRIDDGEDVVTRRLIVYKEETEQLVGYYKGSPTFYRINGFQPPATVTAEIRAALEASQKEAARLARPVDVRP
jgi:adenylate kinase